MQNHNLIELISPFKMVISFGNYQFDLGKPIDISTLLHDGEPQINCYSAPFFKTEPVRMGNFIGSTNEGGLLNYKNVFLNPHGNGTHTECVAHISDIDLTINKALKEFHFIAELITIQPTQIENGDNIILKSQLVAAIKSQPQAIIIRTLPNGNDKLTKNYNGTNPAYLHHEAAAWLVENAVNHLLIDLPSMDREEDGGKLLAHHAFFSYPEYTRTNATITELIYVPDEIADGIYLLNLQIVSFELDVSPSKPVLYAVLK